MLSVDYRAWLADAFQRTKKPKNGLAAAMNVPASAISKILAGTREVGASEFEIMKRYFNDDGTAQVDTPKPKVVETPTPIKIIGTVAAGVWREVGLEADRYMIQDENPFPPDPRFPVAAQFDLIVSGTSLNKVAAEGARLRCVDIMEAGVEIRNGDLVIVRRIRDSFGVETTAKRLKVVGGRRELWPDSTDPKWQAPIVLNGPEAEEITITAVVLWAYTPVRP